LSNSSNKNSIILISEKPACNPQLVVSYEKLSPDYSIYLNTLLISNWVEIISEIKNSYKILTLFDIRDKEFLPKYLLPEEFNVNFYNNDQLSNIAEKILKNKNDNAKNLILFCDSIGLTQSDIPRVFSLVQSDEPSMAIGKSNRDHIVFTCTFRIEKEFIDPLINSHRKYSKYLKSVMNTDIYLYTLDKFLAINDFQDIKKLYIELSKKESLSYCSQKMHESFNDLFIEYKDLLNV